MIYGTHGSNLSPNGPPKGPQTLNLPKLISVNRQYDVQKLRDLPAVFTLAPRPRINPQTPKKLAKIIGFNYS